MISKYSEKYTKTEDFNRPNTSSCRGDTNCNTVFIAFPPCLRQGVFTTVLVRLGEQPDCWVSSSHFPRGTLGAHLWLCCGLMCFLGNLNIPHLLSHNVHPP